MAALQLILGRDGVPTTLAMGSQGAVVRSLQRSLAEIGYKLKGTAYFGPATDTAVEDFQRKHKLKDDGIVGPLTAAALDEAVAVFRAEPVHFPPLPKPPVDEGRPLWLAQAFKWLGTKEVAGAKDNPDLLDLADEVGGKVEEGFTHDSVAWCAMWANGMLHKVGLKGTDSLWALDFDSNKWPNVKLDGPAVGAFAPMQRKNKAGKVIGGHITIIVGRDKAGNLMGIGGNQSDAVTIAAFPPKRIKSFRWPLGPSLPKEIGFESLPIVASDGKVSTKET